MIYLILTYLFNAVLCIWMAVIDANKIKESIKINHTKNGAIHIISGLLVAILFGWPHFFAWLCECAIVFDISLSLFRGLSPFYVSPKPKSLKDRAEKFFFGNNGFLPKVIYLIIFIIMQFI